MPFCVRREIFRRTTISKIHFEQGATVTEGRDGLAWTFFDWRGFEAGIVFP
jgi:hypothetical protein